MIKKKSHLIHRLIAAAFRLPCLPGHRQRPNQQPSLQSEVGVAGRASLPLLLQQRQPQVERRSTFQACAGKEGGDGRLDDVREREGCW